MNVAQWQCKLHPSRRARHIQWALLSGAMVFVALIPAAENGALFKTVLLALMLWEGWRNDRHLRQREGWLQRESAHCWCWQGIRWQPQQPLRWLPNAVLLVGKSEQGKKLRMWLMQDNMQPTEWRVLRACCLSEPAATDPLK